LFLAALFVAALAAGCSSTQKDQALATDIKAKMFSDPQVKTANVDVAVKDGEATLSVKFLTMEPATRHSRSRLILPA
jgi:outer membrane murein-binding lipoprotein Lpp